MKKNIVFLVMATLFWSGNFIFAKIGLKTLSPVELATGRFIVAAAILILILLSKKDLTDWKVTKRKLPVLIVSGFIGVFLYNIMMFIGLRSSSPTNGALIMGLNPMFTLILSGIIIKTHINRFQALGIILSFSGVLFVISHGHLNAIAHLKFNLGDLFLLISSLTFGLFNVINKKYLVDLNTFTITAFTTFPATILFLIYTFFNNDNALLHLESNAFFSILFMALCGSVLAYYFWNSSVKSIGADKSSVYINLVPFFTAIFSVFLGISISLVQIVGGILIISGVILSSRIKSQKS